MTDLTLKTVVEKHAEGPGSALSGTPYPALVALVDRMTAEDPRVIFDSLRPVGDEFWNMIDGRRSVGQIAEAVCLEFGFELSPELFLPLVESLVAAGEVTLVRGREEV